MLATPPVVIPPPATVAVPANGALSIEVPFVASSPGPWSALVDYGDGSGVQNAVVGAGQRILLNHNYGSAGAYHVSVILTAASGLLGSASLAVDVAAAPSIAIGSGKVVFSKNGRTKIELTFSGDVNGAADLGGYRLVSPGKDKQFGTRDDKTIKLASAVYDSAHRVVAITTKARLAKSSGPLRLTTTDGWLTDDLGRPVDGNHDGKPSGTFTATLSRRKLTIASAFPAARHRHPSHR